MLQAPLGPLDPGQGTRLRRRLARRSAGISIAASLVGAALVFAYLELLSPTEGCGDCDSSLGMEIALVSGYFVVAAVVTDRLARL
jgi:hypothetical protein